MIRRRGRAPWIGAFAVYVALAILTTWPAARHLASGFPHDSFDPALNAWILWWNARAVPLTGAWWSPPSFWPLTGALSLSEHLLGLTFLTTPLLRLGVGAVATYNIALLASYPLTALAAHALAYVVVRRHGPALVAGLIVGFSPYRVAQLAHIQMLWAFGMPLALLAAHRYIEDGGWGWLVALGAAWLDVALSNSYYLLFFPVLMAVWMLWFGRASIARSTAILVALIVASLPLIPILWTYADFHRLLHLTRRVDEIESFGADLAAIVTTTPEMRLWRPLSIGGRGEGQLFPGAVALVLFAIGIVSGIRARRTSAPPASAAVTAVCRGFLGLAVVAAVLALSSVVIGPWQMAIGGRSILSVSSPEKPLTVVMVLLALACASTATFAAVWRDRSAPAFYTLAALLMWAFSWGPHPRLANTPIFYDGPYSVLLDLPGLSEVRVPARFGMLMVICLAMAAAIAFARATRRMTSPAQMLATIVCGVAIVAESWPAIAIEPPAAPIAALQRADLEGPVLELPLGQSWLDAPAQFRGITHGRPVVNGYSGYAPPHYHLIELALNLNDGDVLRGLTAASPLVVALNKHEEPARWRRLVEGLHAEHVADDDGFDIYRLAKDDQKAAQTHDPLLPIKSIDVSAGGDRVNRMLDGNLTTEWNSQRVQAGGEFVTVDLGEDRHVSTVRLTSAEFIGDYPRRLAVECAADGGQWSPCWSGSIAGILLRSLLDQSTTAAAAIPIDRDRVRRIKVTQTAVDPMNGWSIAEIAVLGR